MSTCRGKQAVLFVVDQLS